MTNQIPSRLDRRDVLAGMAAVGSVLLATDALAADAKPAKPAADAAPPATVSPALKAVLESSNACLATGRVCLARCTDHLAGNMTSMADCQRAVMNMLAVTEAMAATSAYRNSPAKQHKALAAVCADYCRTCAVECEKHASMHAECKACGEACRACIKACDAYVAEK